MYAGEQSPAQPLPVMATDGKWPVFACFSRRSDFFRLTSPIKVNVYLMYHRTPMSQTIFHIFPRKCDSARSADLPHGPEPHPGLPRSRCITSSCLNSAPRGCNCGKGREEEGEGETREGAEYLGRCGCLRAHVDRSLREIARCLGNGAHAMPRLCGMLRCCGNRFFWAQVEHI